jgi:hypothetical protein
MMKKIIIIVVLLASHSMLFVGGAFMGKKITVNRFVGEITAMNAEMELGQYASYRDIARNIKDGNFLKAKCAADSIASSMFNGVKACMLEENCKVNIQQSVRQLAPEIFGSVPIPFDYISMKNGLGACGGN